VDNPFADAYLCDRNIPHRLTYAPSKVVAYAIAQIAADSSARRWLDQRQPPVVFIGLDDSAFTWHVTAPPPAGSAVIIFGHGVLAKPSLQSAAVIAHEIGHVWLRDHGQATGGQHEELAADAKAAEWGFERDLAASLKADVATESDPKKKAQLQARVDALLGSGALRPASC
jgi:hypothetical protein